MRPFVCGDTQWRFYDIVQHVCLHLWPSVPLLYYVCEALIATALVYLLSLCLFISVDDMTVTEYYKIANSLASNLRSGVIIIIFCFFASLAREGKK